MPLQREPSRIRGALLFLLSPLLLLASASAGAVSQDDPARDLTETVALLRAVHPAPHRYVSADELDALVAAEIARLGALEAVDDLQIGQSLHRVLARVGDSHLAVALPSLQPGARSEPMLLPVVPKRVGDRVYVDASEPPMPAGTELLAIDGVPIGALWERLASLVLVDGARPALQSARLDRDFALPFHLATGVRPEYELLVRAPDGERRTVVLPAVDREGMGALRARRISAPLWGAPPGGRPPWPTLERPADDVVLLRLASFGVADQDGYRQRVDELFAGLTGDETLILDVRGNPGGLRTNGIALLEHLIEGPYAQWIRIETRVREIPERHRDRVSFPFTPPDVLRTFPGDPRGDRRIFEGDPLAGRMTGSDRPHSGQVIAFVDDGTDSAAVEMLVALRAHRPGVRLVGRETGGECGRHVGEIPVMLTTPAELRVLMSLAAITHVETAGCRAGRGVEPDLALEYDLDDFLEGRDPYVGAILAGGER